MPNEKNSIPTTDGKHHIKISKLLERAFYRAREDEDNLLIKKNGDKLNGNERSVLFDKFPDVFEIEANLQKSREGEITVYDLLNKLKNTLAKYPSGYSVSDTEITHYIEKLSLQLSEFNKSFATLTDLEQKQISAYKPSWLTSDPSLKETLNILSNNLYAPSIVKNVLENISLIMSRYRNDLENTEFLLLDDYYAALNLADNLSHALDEEQVYKFSSQSYNILQHKPPLPSLSVDDLNKLEIYLTISQFLVSQLKQSNHSVVDMFRYQKCLEFKAQFDNDTEYGKSISVDALKKMDKKLQSFFSQNDRPSVHTIFSKKQTNVYEESKRKSVISEYLYDSKIEKKI